MEEEKTTNWNSRHVAWWKQTIKKWHTLPNHKINTFRLHTAGYVRGNSRKGCTSWSIETVQAENLGEDLVENTYEVSKIVNHKVNKGEVFYRVRWAGMSDEYRSSRTRIKSGRTLQKTVPVKASEKNPKTTKNIRRRVIWGNRINAFEKRIRNNFHSLFLSSNSVFHFTLFSSIMYQWHVIWLPINANGLVVCLFCRWLRLWPMAGTMWTLSCVRW